MKAIWVEITATRGSAPRDAGTAMKVTEHGILGTIGGGALEFRALRTAREMLASARTEHAETLPLGPNLGQCCGGAVTLRYTDRPKQTDPQDVATLETDHHGNALTPLWIWGAGHVGRAVVQAAPSNVFEITWIDSAADRFPAEVADHVAIVPATDMPRLAAHAPLTAQHLIFTYSHDIDLAICAALLKQGAKCIGLIGSDTKWARFSTRLRAMGLDPTPITCPIGDKSLGKRPDQIAYGTIACLLARPEREAIAS